MKCEDVNSADNRKIRVKRGPTHALRNVAQATPALRMNAKRPVNNGAAVGLNRAHGGAALP